MLDSYNCIRGTGWPCNTPGQGGGRQVAVPAVPGLLPTTWSLPHLSTGGGSDILYMQGHLFAKLITNDKWEVWIPKILEVACWQLWTSLPILGQVHLLGASRDLLPIFGNLKISLAALIYSELTVDAGEPAPRVDIRHCHHSGQHVSLHFPPEKHWQEDQRWHMPTCGHLLRTFG